MKHLLYFVSAVFLSGFTYAQEVDLSKVHIVNGVVSKINSTYSKTDGGVAKIIIDLMDDKDVHAAYIGLEENKMTLLKSDRSPMMTLLYETYSMRFTDKRSKVVIEVEGIYRD